MYNPEIIKAMQAVARYNCDKYHAFTCNESCPLFLPNGRCLSTQLSNQLRKLGIDPYGQYAPGDSTVPPENDNSPTSPYTPLDGPDEAPLPRTPDSPPAPATASPAPVSPILASLERVAADLDAVACGGVDYDDCPLHLTERVQHRVGTYATACLQVLYGELGNPKFKKC